jgi:hypothetical protein
MNLLFLIKITIFHRVFQQITHAKNTIVFSNSILEPYFFFYIIENSLLNYVLVCFYTI